MATVLLLHGDGANGSATVLDEVGHAVTANGNAQISTAQYKFGGSSLLFDGTGDYLSLASSADWTFGTGDFTIECFVYINSYTNATNVLVNNYGGNVVGRFGWALTNSGTTIQFRNADTTVVEKTLSTPIGTGAWVHVAVCRASGVIYMFSGGVLATSSATFTDNLSVNAALGIGTYGPTYPSDSGINGYLDEIRITKGEALYTAAFTPPDRAVFYNNTVLLLHGDGTNGSTTIKDEAGHAVTVNGNAQISTAQSKFGGASIAFDGTGDYISLASSSDFGFGANEFTIEMWVYHASGTGAQQLIGQRTTNVNSGVYLFLQSGSVHLYLGDGSSWIVTDLNMTFTTAAWWHLAIVRKGTNVYMFKDGVLSATATSVTGSLPSTGPLYFGVEAYQNSVYFNGYLDDVRICKAAKYTAAFTPPTAAHDYEYTKLLIHADGANNATGILEETGRAITVSGNAKISTTQYKFGGSAMYFDGTADYLTIADSSDLELGTGDFTIETWIYPDSVSGTFGLCGKQNGSFSFQGYVFYVTTGGVINVSAVTTDNNTAWTTTISSSSGALTAGVWQHVAAVRRSGTLYIYVNGTQVATGSFSLAIVDNSSGLAIGALKTDGSFSFSGYIDEFRLSVGIARYTSNFTPPAIEFVLLGQYIYTISGLVRDDTGAFAARTVRLYRRDTGALVSEAVSNGATGEFTFTNPLDLEYYVVCLDDASGTQYNARIYDKVTRG